MNYDNMYLSFDEKVTFTLRDLYRKNGYTQYKMSKFEEYDLYAKNKDFLVSDSIITFTDTNGKLMALKPDVTLSIIKNVSDTDKDVQKVFYNENVYRISKGNNSYKEIMQAGLECFGEITDENICEVLKLAVDSLKTISDKCVLEISALDMITDILDRYDLSKGEKIKVLNCIGEKSTHELSAVCKELSINDSDEDVIKALISSVGKAEDVLPVLIDELSDKTDARPLESLYDIISSLDTETKEYINIDFSVISDIKYYNGIVFQGFVERVPDAVLSGGQYDKLMQRMKRRSRALGFAVYLDSLDRIEQLHNESDDSCSDDFMLNVALPKGRLGEKVYAMFEKAGFECPSIKENNRKLIFENKEKGVRYFWVKPSDVAIYVERGAADIGVAGKDILLEYSPQVYELLDLDIGKCKMAVAAKKDFVDDINKTLRVATKFANIASKHYMSKGRDIDIIHLNGSIEIAPILDLSDVIVDIVETGTTLKENNLEVVEDIVPISARFICNKTSYEFKSGKINNIVESIAKQGE